MIDNYLIIKGILENDDINVFYLCTVVKRRKDNPSLERNSEVIKTFYISGKDDLEKKRGKIIEYCTLHQARAYIDLNRRDYKTFHKTLLKKLSDLNLISSFNISPDSLINSVIGNMTKLDKSWIIDIDEEFINIQFKIQEWLTERGVKFTIIPTKTGVHLITKTRFNRKEFWDVFGDKIPIEGGFFGTLLYMP